MQLKPLLQYSTPVELSRLTVWISPVLRLLAWSCWSHHWMSCSLLSCEEGGEWTREASSYSALWTQWTYTVVRGSVMGQDFRLQLSSPNRHELWQMQVGSKQASFVVWKRWEFGYHRLQSSSYTPLSAICVSPSVQGTVDSAWGREQTGEWCTHQLTFW